jgi:hypothetical protein
MGAAFAGKEGGRTIGSRGAICEQSEKKDPELVRDEF